MEMLIDQRPDFGLLDFALLDFKEATKNNTAQRERCFRKKLDST